MQWMAEAANQYLLLNIKGDKTAENQRGRCGGTITQLMSSDIYMGRSVGEGMEAAASLR